NTWDRIGAALEQSQVGKITERDPGWKTYTVMVSPQKDAPAAPAAAPAPPKEHHWYSRILHPFSGGGSSSPPPPSGADSEVKIKVKADPVGARVLVRATAEDAQSAAAAQRVVSTLRDLLMQQATTK